MIHRHDACVRERDAPVRHVTRHAELEGDRVRAARVHVPDVEALAAAELERLRVAPAREQAAVLRQLRDRELAAPLLDALHIAADAAPCERRDVDVVAFLERDPLSVRRRDDLVGRREAQMLLSCRCHPP